jgi:STAS domain
LVGDGRDEEVPVSPGDGSATVVLVVDGHATVAAWPVERSRFDLALVDAIARLELAARRRGCSVRVVDPSGELLALLELVGLAGVLGASALGVEVGREPEGGEQLGVEEVVEPGDPPV